MLLEIFGAGVAGSYLANLLDGHEDINYILYEKSNKTKCPSPCAFGWANYSGVKTLVSKIGLNAEDYVLARPERVVVNGVEIKIRDVVTFDKPRFINDMRENVKVTYELPSAPISQLLVDATGYNRALMGGSPTKLVTIQEKVVTKDLDPDYIYIYGKPYGYAWAFPLDNNEWHIGSGAFTEWQAQHLRAKLLADLSIRCEFGKYGIKCRGCNSPIIWDPDVGCAKYNIETCQWTVAVGEAGGFVSGFGEGNTLAMETANVLFDAIMTHDSVQMIVNDYMNRVREVTAWIRPQYDFIKTANKSLWRALPKIKTVVQTANTRNLDVSVWDGLRLLWALWRR